MLSKSTLYPTLPAVDLQRARKFYEGILGLRVLMADEKGLMLQVGDCHLYVYRRGPTKADHTVAAFDVENVESAVKDLKKKGVKFEEYDRPEMNLKTVNSIATMDGTKSARFKDSEGNILAIVQMDEARMKSIKQMASTTPTRDEPFNY